MAAAAVMCAETVVGRLMASISDRRIAQKGDRHHQHVLHILGSAVGDNFRPTPSVGAVKRTSVAPI